MSGSDLFIQDSDTQKAITAASHMTRLLNESSAKSEALLKKVQQSNWNGEAKESFVAYLTILVNYHQGLRDVSEKQKEALRTLRRGLSEYESHPEVMKVKKL